MIDYVRGIPDNDILFSSAYCCSEDILNLIFITQKMSLYLIKFIISELSSNLYNISYFETISNGCESFFEY